MKFSNCFLLNALVYLTVASMTLPGKDTNFFAAAKNTSATKIEKKSKAAPGNEQDFKSELILGF